MTTRPRTTTLHQDYEETQARRDAYAKRWPFYCRACDGHGLRDRNARGRRRRYHLCEACTDNGICARCAKPRLTAEIRGDETTGEGPCKACGWNYDDGLPSVEAVGPLSGKVSS